MKTNWQCLLKLNILSHILFSSHRTPKRKKTQAKHSQNLIHKSEGNKTNESIERSVVHSHNEILPKENKHAKKKKVWIKEKWSPA